MSFNLSLSSEVNPELKFKKVEKNKVGEAYLLDKDLF
jgi:hypothetical protein